MLIQIEAPRLIIITYTKIIYTRLACTKKDSLRIAKSWDKAVFFRFSQMCSANTEFILQIATYYVQEYAKRQQRHITQVTPILTMHILRTCNLWGTLDPGFMITGIPEN